MTTKERIEQDLVRETKARNAFAVSVLRMLRAALKNAEIHKRGPLSDEDVVSVIGSEAKKLRDALESFKAGARQDLVDKTERELEVLGSYLPAQLTDDEVRGIVAAQKAALGITSPSDFGRLMGAVAKETKGRADGARVSALVKEALSQAGA